MPSTRDEAARAPELDHVVLAVGAAVLVGVLLMGASIVHANAMASAPRPHVTVTWSGSGPGGSPPGQTPSLRVVGNPSPARELVGQTLGASVLPGRLTMTTTGGSVTLTPDGGIGNGGRYRGTLPVVTVVDARGTLVGWNATVSLQGIDGLSPSQLASARLCAQPNAPTVVAGNPGEVRSAGRTCGGAGSPVTVFFARPNGGGGTFTDTAALTLTVPWEVGANPLTAEVASRFTAYPGP